MQHAGIGAAGDDGRIGRRPSAAAQEAIEQFRLQVALHQAGAAGPHGPQVALHADFRGPAHQLDFRRRLDQPQLMQQGLEAEDSLRRAQVLGAGLGQPAAQALVKAGMLPQRAVNGACRADEGGHSCIEFGQRMSGVQAQRPSRPLGTQPFAVVEFLPRIPLATKQDGCVLVAAVVRLLPPPAQRQHRPWFRKAGQIPEVAVLTKGGRQAVINSEDPGAGNDG